VIKHKEKERIWKHTHCPLCSSQDLAVVEKIKTKDLSFLWSFKRVNTRELFNRIEILNKIKCRNCMLEFFDPLIGGDDNFYSKLAKEEWYYLHGDKTEFNYSAKYIESKDLILDIGAGRGAFAKKLDKSIKYKGLELNSKAVEYASKDGVNVVKETIEEHCKNNKNKYNVVVSFQVLEHVVDVGSFLESSISVVRKGGLFIIAVPNNNSFIRKSQNNILNLPPHHIFHWSRKSLDFIANKYNLEVVDVYKERVSDIHKGWYYATYIQSRILRLFRLGPGSVNVNISNIFIQKLSFVLSKLLIFSKTHKKQDGHTIIVTLKKT